MFYWYVYLIIQVTVQFAKFDNNIVGLILNGLHNRDRVRCTAKIISKKQNCFYLLFINLINPQGCFSTVYKSDSD